MQFFTRQKYTYPEHLGHLLITFFCNYFIFSMLHLLKKVNQQFRKNKKAMTWMLIWDSAVHYVHGGMVGTAICGTPFRETH